MVKSSVTAKSASKEEVRKTKKSTEENKTMEVDRVGAILYNERVKKNIDLSEISQKLCIRKYYLEAIEKGEYRNLPSMPYSAGFVDAYAKYLGLNNTRITQLFREEIEVKPQTVNLIQEDTTAEARLPRKLYVLLGLLLIALLAWIWNYSSPLKENNNTSATIEEAADDAALNEGDVEYYQTVEKMLESQDENLDEEIKETENSKEKQAEDVEEKEKSVETEQEKVSGLEIKIKKENTWLEVKDAEKVYLNRILKVGETYRLPDPKGKILSAGKYDGVEVYVDGKLVPVFSKNKKTNISIDSLLNNH